MNLMTGFPLIRAVDFEMVCNCIIFGKWEQWINLLSEKQKYVQININW